VTAFRFVAVRPDGGTVRGRMEGAREAEIAAHLSRRGLLPVEVTPIEEKPPWPWDRPASGELALVFRGLASLVGAGIPLAKALESAQRLAQGSLGLAFERVRTRVSEGVTLGGALAEERRLVPPATIGLVSAGESGVGLAAALEAAALELERDAETAASLKAALAYPLVLLVVGAMSLFGILVFVVPRFAEVLGDASASLPAATRVLLAASAVVRRHALLMLAIGTTLGGVTVAAIRARRAAWHAWLLAVPLVGELRHQIATVRVARILGRLLDTGTPATASLEIARRTVGDTAIAQRLAAAASRVAQGASLSQGLADERALTPLALGLAAVGDGTGQLGCLLTRAADIEDAALRQRIRTAVQLIEPLLIVLLAGFVALVALALLQAVYSVRPAAL
jgi:general secretion pathway protein F